MVDIYRHTCVTAVVGSADQQGCVHTYVAHIRQVSDLCSGVSPQVYDLPISKAARSLGVGVTVLKKICRDLHVFRW
jgi:hypothetical protein